MTSQAPVLTARDTSAPGRRTADGSRANRRRSSRLKRAQARWGMIFALPAVVILAYFTVWPSLQALFYSFTDWDGATAHWIGLENYVQGLLQSADFARVLLNNLLAILSTPFGVAIALIIAFLLSTGVRGARTFRTMYFLPVLLSWVIIGLCWGYLLSSRGFVNVILHAVGLGVLAQDWLGQPSTSMLMIIAVFNWGYVGMNVLILYTGMMSIDPNIIEAARLDGAQGYKLMRHLILPHTRRYIELTLIITMAAVTTQLFGLIFTMTAGGPGVSSTTLEYSLYTTSFQDGNFAQGAALGIVLFLVTLIFTIVRIRSGSRADDD